MTNENQRKRKVKVATPKIKVPGGMEWVVSRQPFIKILSTADVQELEEWINFFMKYGCHIISAERVRDDFYESYFLWVGNKSSLGLFDFKRKKNETSYGGFGT